MRCTRLVVLKRLVVLTGCTLLLPAVARAAVVDFENLSLAPDSYWNGSDATYNAGGGDYNSFQSGEATLNNYHDWYYSSYFGMEMHYWEGWAYSNRTQTGSSGSDESLGEYTAMGSLVPGQNGAGGSAQYGVSYVGWYAVPTVTLDTPALVSGAYFTNNNWAYLSMLHGDGFAKKFGDGDWFKLTITAHHVSGPPTSMDFFLADFQNGNHYIIDEWTFVDLSSLGDSVKSLEFRLTSSDTGPWGMNTPAYFAMDNLTTLDQQPVPEPSSFAVFAGGGLVLGVVSLLRRCRSACR